MLFFIVLQLLCGVNSSANFELANRRILKYKDVLCVMCDNFASENIVPRGIGTDFGDGKVIIPDGMMNFWAWREFAEFDVVKKMKTVLVDKIKRAGDDVHLMKRLSEHWLYISVLFNNGRDGKYSIVRALESLFRYRSDNALDRAMYSYFVSYLTACYLGNDAYRLDCVIAAMEREHGSKQGQKNQHGQVPFEEVTLYHLEGDDRMCFAEEDFTPGVKTLAFRNGKNKSLFVLREEVLSKVLFVLANETIDIRKGILYLFRRREAEEPWFYEGLPFKPSEILMMVFLNNVWKSCGLYKFFEHLYIHMSDNGCVGACFSEDYGVPLDGCKYSNDLRSLIMKAHLEYEKKNMALGKLDGAFWSCKELNHLFCECLF